LIGGRLEAGALPALAAGLHPRLPHLRLFRTGPLSFNNGGPATTST
jgi:hypothetical protein